MSDFDNSDEDIASLLADDEDDMFSKKPFRTSPEKKTAKAISNISPKKSANVAKHDILKQESLEKHSFKSSPVKHGVSKTSSKEISDTDDDDALNDLLSDSSMPSFLRGTKNSPAKKNETKSKDFLDDESKYLDELGFSKLSSDSVLKNQRNSLKSSIGEGDQSEDDDDILKSLGSDERGPTSPKRKASFFDDFLKSLSPKQSPKKSTPPASKPLLEQIEKEEDPFDDDILEKVSSKSKTSHQSQKHSTPENKRGTLIKQVSFKDLPKTSPKLESPVKERKSSLKKESEPEIKSINKHAAAPSKRSDKMGLSKSDDTDWLSFFKESPKKTNKSSESENKLKSPLPEESSITSNAFKANANRRRSSSADWLGLSESHALSNDTAINENSRTVKKDADIASEEFLQSTRPHTTGSLTTTKPRRKLAEDLSWLGEDPKSDRVERKKEIPEAVHSDKNPIYLPEDKKFSEDNELKLESKKLLAQPSKVPLKRDNPSAKPFMKTTAPVQNTSEFDIQGTEKSSMDSQFSRLPENMYDITSKAVNLGEKSHIIGGSNDYALQAIINNHALEREQLMKTNEATKQMYEERIKAIESLHRDQLKSLEESLKSVEAKLKLDIENTINSYEEKLSNLKQEKNLIEKDKKEKLELTEKQNLSEIQRLKDLHSQSIESMKRDHEDALSRLQRLKEQEIEAILSTQSHSRSLQQLADQLESRTAELASLQTKVEERNQTTWREKQLLLEAKERDLKSIP